MSISRSIAQEARKAKTKAKRLVSRKVERFAFASAVVLAVGGVLYELLKKPSS
jgi:hypothetical protein